MSTWSHDELAAFAAAKSLMLRAGTEDPAGECVEVGMVVVHDRLYVRAHRGTASVWFQATRSAGHGRVWTDGVAKSVSFTPADPGLAGEIDAAYRAKYHRYDAALVDFVVSPAARSATVQIVPRFDLFADSQRAVVAAIGAVLLNLMPANATQITAEGDLGEESAGVSIQWRTTAGKTEHFAFDEQPFEEIIQLSDAFMSLRELMTADEHDSWHRITFTTDRDGQFDVDLSYDQPK